MEKIKVAGIYIQQDNKVLMVQEKGQAWGLWCVPMGHVNFGETSRIAVEREAEEETGYDIEIIGEIEPWTIEGVDYKGGESDNDKLIELHFFVGKIIEGNIGFDKKELLDCKWIKITDLDTLPLRGGWLKELFKKVKFMEEKNTDFKILITLPSWKTKIVEAELSKKNIFSKIVDHGTNISWKQLRGGGSSSEIFMPAFPRDIYVPENRLNQSRGVLQYLGFTENEIVFPKVRKWQKILAIIAILSIILGLVAVFLSIF